MVKRQARFRGRFRSEQGGGGPGIDQHSERTVTVNDRVDKYEAVFYQDAAAEYDIVHPDCRPPSNSVKAEPR
jgi:hypothetical protein